MDDAGARALRPRATAIAVELGHGHLGVEHVVGALLTPPEATTASAVLHGLGATYDRWAATGRVRGGSPRKLWGLPSTPALLQFLALARGLALGGGGGADGVTDDLALVALCYDRDSRIPGHLEELGLDAVEVVAALAARGVPVPTQPPPPAAAPLRPFGPRIGFPGEDLSAVLAAVRGRFSTKDGVWGWNTEADGRCWIDGEEHLDLEPAVRDAVADPSSVTIAPGG